MSKTSTVRRVRSAVRSTVAVIREFADVITIARTVTVANIANMIATHTADHGTLHAGRHVARFTGHRVMQTQNDTLTRNSEWQLDDVQLLFVWRVLFPVSSGKLFTGSIADGIGIVRGVRADYNRTGHDMPSGKPAIESVSYGAKRFDVTPAVVVSPVTVSTAKPKTVRARETA